MSASGGERFPWGVRVALLIVAAVVLVAGFVWLMGDDPDSGARSGCLRTRPEPPAAVRENTTAGIEATVRFEYRAVNYGQCTGDVAPLSQVYDLRACVACSTFVQGLPTYTAGGNRFVTGNYTIVALESFLDKRPDGTIVGSARFATKRSVVKIVDRGGKTVRSYAAQPEAFFSDTLEFRDGRWVITSSGLG